MKAMTFKEMEKILNIEVVDPEVVEPNNEDLFKLWFFNMGGNLNFTKNQITNGYKNHIEKWKSIS
jgi:hypothetical protein